MKCICYSDMRLVFYKPKDSSYTFFWGCTDYPNCGVTSEYIRMQPKLDIGTKDTMEALEILKKGNNEEIIGIINEFKVQMVDILTHFIDCSWGAHYMTLYNEIIVPYLDDPWVLKYVLNSSIIKESYGNVYRGKSGAKMYDLLLYYLRDVKSHEIQQFLKEEFQDKF